MIKTDFSLSLLDFLIYLFPGALIIIICFLANPSFVKKWGITEIDKYIIIFILSYIIGHLLTLVSSLIPRIFNIFKRINIFRKKLNIGISDEIKSLRECIKDDYSQDIFNQAVDGCHPYLILL